MGQTRAELREQIKRSLGYPLVKIELTDSQLDDAINMARNMYIKWAAGESTKEVWFTLLLKGGQRIYDLPAGVTEVISYTDKGSSGMWPGGSGTGINTLFTMDNYFYQRGYYDALSKTSYDYVTYHLAKDFLETSSNFVVNKYDYRYHKHTNQLEVQPTPVCNTGNVTQVTTTAPSGTASTASTMFRYPGSGACALDSWMQEIDGAGWALIQAYMIEGSTLPSYTATSSTSGSIFKIDENYAEYLYEYDWIIEYASALAKITLGRIRSKFPSFSSIGNIGISLDGSELIGEGKEEKRELEERLRKEESSLGYGILMM